MPPGSNCVTKKELINGRQVSSGACVSTAPPIQPYNVSIATHYLDANFEENTIQIPNQGKVDDRINVEFVTLHLTVFNNDNQAITINNINIDNTDFAGVFDECKNKIVGARSQYTCESRVLDLNSDSIKNGVNDLRSMNYNLKIDVSLAITGNQQALILTRMHPIYVDLLTNKCSDGTPYGQCSLNYKPFMCLPVIGNYNQPTGFYSLQDKASICGCPIDTTKDGDVCISPSCSEEERLYNGLDSDTQEKIDEGLNTKYRHTKYCLNIKNVVSPKQGYLYYSIYDDHTAIRNVPPNTINQAKDVLIYLNSYYADLFSKVPTLKKEYDKERQIVFYLSYIEHPDLAAANINFGGFAGARNIIAVVDGRLSTPNVLTHESTHILFGYYSTMQCDAGHQYTTIKLSNDPTFNEGDPRNVKVPCCDLPFSPAKSVMCLIIIC